MWCVAVDFASAPAARFYLTPFWYKRACGALVLLLFYIVAKHTLAQEKPAHQVAGSRVSWIAAKISAFTT